MSKQHIEQRQDPHPGRMSAMMHAVPVGGPKVLRLGVVQSGRFIEERVIRQRTHVTLGATERNTLIVASAQVPPKFRLFELIGSKYVLNFVDSMSGQIVLETAVEDLSAFTGRATCRPNGINQLELTEESRGKIRVGDVTILFQFIAAAPISEKTQLPKAVLRGTVQTDWTTTLVAAFSFLLHFLAVGSIYSDWLDPVVDDDSSLATLVDTVRSLPTPPPVEDRTEPAAEDASPKNKEVAQKPSIVQKSSAGRGNSPKQITRDAAAKLAGALDSIEMATIGSLKQMGAATQNVLGRGDLATDRLDELARLNAGVGPMSNGLKVNPGGERYRVGSPTPGLDTIGNRGVAEQNQLGTVAKPIGPKSVAVVQAPTVNGGGVANAGSVVAQMKAAFRNCYNRELAANPDASGTIRLTLMIGAGGEVQSASSSATGNLGSAVECVRGRAAKAQFDAPDGGSAVIVIPVTFVKQ